MISRSWHSNLAVGAIGAACGIALVILPMHGGTTDMLIALPFVLAMLMGIAKSGTA